MKAPDYIEPIRAYRSWLINPFLGDNTMLRSMVRGDQWKHPLMRADVRPSLNNSSGIYAVKDPWHSPYAFGNPTWGFTVVGAVELSGHVVEHTRGYRATTCKIASFISLMSNHMPVNEERDLRCGLTQRYGVPLYDVRACDWCRGSGLQGYGAEYGRVCRKCDGFGASHLEVMDGQHAGKWFPHMGDRRELSIHNPPPRRSCISTDELVSPVPELLDITTFRATAVKLSVWTPPRIMWVEM